MTPRVLLSRPGPSSRTVEDDYIGIYDPTGSNDDFGSGSEPSGIQSFSNENGNYLVAEDIGKDGGSNPTELVWGPFNTSSYEACAKAIIAFAQDNMDMMIN